MTELRPITLHVNGRDHTDEVEPRLLLSDFLRHRLRLTGTHVGCEHGVCGACTILLDGEPVRSCLTFAHQAAGHEITTVENLAGPDGTLNSLQQAFRQAHALQCGYCTPGMILMAKKLLDENPNPTDDDVRHYLSGNLCRCAAYPEIIAAVHRAAELRRAT